MTFRDYRKTAYAANVLDENKFAETVTFFPAAGGPGVSIVANVQELDDEETQNREGIAQTKQQIRVSMLRDPDHEKGGRTEFFPRDALLRAGQTDGERWAVDTARVDVTDHSIAGMFVRFKLKRAGTTHEE